jgi:hypothetical protein
LFESPLALPFLWSFGSCAWNFDVSRSYVIKESTEGMDLVLIGRLLIGAGAGATLGYFLVRVRPCSTGACNVRANLIYSVIAGAVFGAGVAWYFAR